MVLTSSLVAVMHMVNGKTHYGPDDWSDVNSQDAYGKSKYFAEKAAWDHVKLNPSLELAVCNPGIIFGPNLVKCEFMSGEFLNAILQGKIPFFPKIHMPIIDVRDCARAHLQAVLVPEAAG